MSTMKRCISLLLVILILVGVFPPEAQAAPSEETASVNTDNVTIEGTNGFGNLLSQEITENQEASEAADAEYPGGYAVTDLVIEGNTATVTYDTMEEATLVVALYTEDGMQMVTSTTTTVSPDTTEAALIFEGEVPEYFLVSAYLLDVYDFSPLCAAYDTPMYTQEMQELLASTVNDYDPEKVLNLDDNETTNFAVYADSTMVIEAVEGHNIVASIDDDNSIYIIENADEQITTLTEGDIFAYAYTENEILIIKVASITIDGTTVTITSADLEMEDVFSAAKIEGTSNTSEIVLDNSTADDGVVFEGLQPNSGSEYETNAFEGGGSSDVRVSFRLKKETPNGSKAEGSVGFSVKLDVSYYISNTRQFLEVSVDHHLTGKIETTGMFDRSFSLGSAYLIPVYGVKCFFEPEFVLKCEGAVSLDIQYGAVTKTVYESGKGITSYTTEKNWEWKPDGEKAIKFLVGINLKPSIAFISRAVSVLEMSVLVGLELDIDSTGKSTNGSDSVSDVVHSCWICYDLELKFIAEFDASVTIFKYIEFMMKPMRMEMLILEAYLSGDCVEIGIGNCPHLEYRITIKVTDEIGNGISGVEVCDNDGIVWGVTNTHGVVVKYLPSGKYTINTTVDNKQFQKSFDVSEAMYVSISSISNEDSKGDTIFDTTPSDTILDYGSVVASGTCGENLSWTRYSSGMLTIDGHGAMENYDNLTAVPWHSRRRDIKAVLIGNDVTTISDYAFHSCYNLSSVSIGQSVTTIGNRAFSDCTSLSSVTIPDSVTTIGNSAFYYCHDLNSVTLGRSVTTINDLAFSSCLKLEHITIPTSVTAIGDSAFSSCSSLGSITIPNSLTVISRGVFSSCTNLSSVIIPDSVTSIGDQAFFGCNNLNSLVIPESVISIGNSAFYHCENLNNIAIPDSVTTIGDSAFFNCDSLSSVILPNSVTSIGNSAFHDCDNLISIEIPDGITTIGSGIFYSCDNLSSITIPNSVITIGDSAFGSCSKLSSISIPDSVTTIGVCAFYLCEALSSVTIGDGVATIGDSAFGSCSKLSSISIPDSVTIIDAYAFSSCQSLNSVTFEGNAPTIGENAFYNVATTAYYPKGNSSWTSDVMMNYGGTINWIEYTLVSGFASNVKSIHSANKSDIHSKPELGINAVYPGEYSTEVSGKLMIKTASFSGLVPNQQYVLLAVIDTKNPDALSPANLLFIDQASASKDGTLMFEYVQRITTDISYVVACGASHKNLNNAEITFPEMVADGELQAVDPIVVYDGVTLVEDRDYVVVGTVDFTEAGEYTCSIRGIHNYTGLVECNYIVGGQVNPFSDVAQGSFYYEPVMWAIENGITNGTSATTFRPNDQCMRAHVVTFLWRAVGSPEPTRTDNPFVDVKPTDFYYKPVLWAVENGITSGMDATHFGPTSYCNRAQVVTFLYRTMGSPEVESVKNPFTDVASGSFYEKPVLWAVTNGVTSGMSATSFGPNSICNRAQIVTFLYRAFVVS